MSTTDRPQRIVLHVWALSVAGALLFGFLQALLMADLWWIVIPMVIVPVGFYLLMRLFIRGVLNRRVPALIVLSLLALAHLILPFRQLIGTRPPSVDGILTALAGAALFRALLPTAATKSDNAART